MGFSLDYRRDRSTLRIVRLADHEYKRPPRTEGELTEGERVILKWTRELGEDEARDRIMLLGKYQ